LSQELKFILKPEVIGRLKAAVAQSGLTDEQFAENCGFTKGQISKLLSGGPQNISKRWLTALHDKCDLNPQWILTGELPMKVEKETIRETYKRTVHDPIAEQNAIARESLRFMTRNKTVEQIREDVLAAVESGEFAQARLLVDLLEEMWPHFGAGKQKHVS